MVDLVFKDSEKKHKFHLVNPSPWPLVGAFSALFLVSGAILYMHYEILWPMLAGLVLILFTMFMWWRELFQSSYMGYINCSMWRSINNSEMGIFYIDN